MEIMIFTANDAKEEDGNYTSRKCTNATSPLWRESQNKYILS